MPLEKLNAFTKKVSDLADKPNGTMTAAQVKAQFDAAPDEVRIYLNQLIDVLQSGAVGDSGADNISATPISTSPSTVQGILEWLKDQIDITLLGQIPDGAITDAKLSDVPGGLKHTVNSHLAKSTTNAHEISNITGLKTALDEKALIGHTHTIENVNGLQSALDAKLAANLRNLANGFVGLDWSGKIPDSVMPIKIVSGSYVGDASVNRFIPVGFTPKYVMITVVANGSSHVANNNMAHMYITNPIPITSIALGKDGGGSQQLKGYGITNGGFTVTHELFVSQAMNYSDTVMHWIAIG